jgi:methylglutaconyl-CoA hydratase
MPLRLTWIAFRVYRFGMSSQPVEFSSAPAAGVIIERAGDVLTLTLNNSEHENEVTGPMFDAMLAELRREVAGPTARVLRIRAIGKVFCTGRERAGRDAAGVRHESERLIEFKRALRVSPLISVAEVQGDAFGFGFGLAIVCDFVYVASNASLGFPEMKFGLAPAAIMAYLGEYALPRFAFPLVLFGDPISPERAREIGLISHVSSSLSLTADVNALIERILRLDPAAARNCKEFFQATLQNTFEQNCRLAADALTAGSMAVLSRKK